MQDEGIPTFIAVIASAVMILGVMVAMAVITWAILLASP